MMRPSVKPPQRKIDKGTLLLWATIAASLALSLVSAYETFVGLLDFMRSSVVGIIASGILTFGIQVLLLVISWSIANSIRDGFRANIVRWAAWVLCAFFSGYFSYYGFLETTGGRNESIRLAEVNATLSNVNLSISEKLVLELETAHQEDIAGDNAFAYNAWLTNSPKKIIEIANSPEVDNQITAAAGGRRTQLVGLRQDTQDLLDPLNTQRVQAQADLASASRNLESLQTRRDAVEKRFNALENNLRDSRNQHAAVTIQHEIELGTGNGQLARALELDVNTALARVESLMQAVTNARAELVTVTEELDRQQFIADEGLSQKRINDLTSQIADLEGKVGEFDAQLQAANEVTAFEFQSLESFFNIATAGLIKKDYQQFDVLTQQCSSLKQQLNDAGLAAEVAGINCSDSAVVESVGRLSNMQDNLNAYDEQCMQGRVQPTRDGAAIAIIQPMIDEALNCVTYVPSPREREAFVSQLNALNTLRGDEADPITVASVALFQDRQGNAVMSLVFALIVDFLVLLCALVGTSRGLPERVRAIDLILTKSRLLTDPVPGIEKRLFTEGLEANHLAMIDPIITDLLRQGLAEYADDTGNKIDLLKGALDRLAALRSQDVSDIYTAVARPARSRPRRPQPGSGRD